MAAGARRVTDEMFVAAARALSDCSPARRDPTGALFPPLEEIAPGRRAGSRWPSAPRRSATAWPSRPRPRSWSGASTRAMWTPRYARMRRKAEGLAAV